MRTELLESLVAPDREQRLLVDVAYRRIVEGVARAAVASSRDLRVGPGDGAAVSLVHHPGPVALQVTIEIVDLDRLRLAEEADTALRTRRTHTLHLACNGLAIHCRKQRGIADIRTGVGSGQHAEVLTEQPSILPVLRFGRIALELDAYETNLREVERVEEQLLDILIVGRCHDARDPHFRQAVPTSALCCGERVESADGLLEDTTTSL